MHAAGWRRNRQTGLRRPRWQPARHLKFLGRHLMRLHSGECKRLMVSMPPRHGKTMLTSRFFVGWWLGRHPADRVITTTHQADLVRKWSRQVKADMVRHGPHVFGVAASARAAASEWDLLPLRPMSDDEEPVEGGVSAVGTGGALTGKGAHLLNCDDLVKGSEDVRNPRVRDNHWQWFEEDLMTRLEPGAPCIVTGTRWHGDDIQGRILKTQADGHPIGGERWEVLNLPALAEEDDPLGREVGEALWEERWSREFLERMRDGMSPGAWASLFQGRPNPAAGNLYEKRWITYFSEDRGDFVADRIRIPSSALIRFVTVDPAWSTKTSADYSVVMAWAFDRVANRLFLLDVFRKRVKAPQLGEAIRASLARWGATIAYIESSNLKLDEMKVLRRAGIPMKEISPNTDKVARFMPVQGHAASGRLLFRRNAPWLPVLEAELLEFGGSPEHDDQADAVAYGVHVANDLCQKLGLIDTSAAVTQAPVGLFPMLRRPI